MHMHAVRLCQIITNFMYYVKLHGRSKLDCQYQFCITHTSDPGGPGGPEGPGTAGTSGPGGPCGPGSQSEYK